MTDNNAKIDNNGIYEYAFYQMYNHIKSFKEKTTNAYNVHQEMEQQLLNLEDDETRIFTLIVTLSLPGLFFQISRMIMQLFSLYSIDYVPNINDTVIPFYRIENNKKIGYHFSNSQFSHMQKFENLKARYNLDGIKIVALVENMEYQELRDQLISHEVNKTNGFIQIITIKELFALISDNEYEVYLSHVKKFNKDIRQLIGYRTIVSPSDSAKIKQKSDLEQELKSKQLSSMLIQDNIHSDQVSIIENNFWHRGLYKAIIGNRPFAESFLASEWYYQNHLEFNELEQTAIIAGYLKSVEQLVFELIQMINRYLVGMSLL